MPRLFRIISILFLALGSLWTHDSRAQVLPPYSNAECVALLTEIDDSRQVEPLSKKSTEIAVSNLKDFRHRQISRSSPSEIEPTAQNLWIESDKATAKDLLQIEEQIEGLERHYQDLDQRKRFNLLIGTEIRGHERIAAFLEAIAESAKGLSSFKKPADKLDAFTYALAFYKDFITLVWVGYLVPHAPDALPRLGHLGPMGWISSLMITGFSVHFVDRFYNMIGAKNWNSRAEQLALKNLASAGAEDRKWIFSSRVYRLPKGFVGKIWRQGKPDLHKQLEMWAHSRRGELGRRLDRLVFGKEYREYALDDIVIIDQLLSKDPQTAEPVLTIFIRSTIEEPKRPRRRIRLRTEKKDEAAASDGVLVPVRSNAR